MTVAEEIAKLRASVKALDNNRPLERAAQTVHGMRVKRIFQDGLSGASYNTTRELWVADKNLRRAGSHKGKTGKAIKTTYFKSYFDLKQQQGFKSGKVNLRLTNDLQSDFANSPQTDGTGAPPIGKVIKVSNNVYMEALRRPKNVQKLKGLVRKYGDFTLFTPDERSKFALIYQAEMSKLLKGIQ